jgi:hypothetical protein
MCGTTSSGVDAVPQHTTSGHVRGENWLMRALGCDADEVAALPF